MLAILHPNTDENSDDYKTTFQFLEELQDIQLQTHVVQGEQQNRLRSNWSAIQKN